MAADAAASRYFNSNRLISADYVSILQVQWKAGSAEEVIDDMVAWVLEHFPNGDESGIVYCLTRKDAEAVSAQLNSRGMRSGFYHADMDPSSRQRTHLLWSKRKLFESLLFLSAEHKCTTVKLHWRHLKCCHRHIISGSSQCQCTC